jgi:hypothetical protein
MWSLLMFEFPQSYLQKIYKIAKFLIWKINDNQLHEHVKN